MRDKLLPYDILAFDVFKQVGSDWAILTVAKYKNGEIFLAQHRGLYFHSKTLHCSISKTKTQSSALKLSALLDKELDLQLRRIQRPLTTHAPEPTRARFEFQSLINGVWSYDTSGRMRFNRRYTNERQGVVIRGKKALVIYMKRTGRGLPNWYGRIDIPYQIIEHTIPELPKYDRAGYMTFTLRSPPKIYQILNLDELHRYTGYQPGRTLSESSQRTSKRQEFKLKRKMFLHRDYDRNVGLCMVYRIKIPSHQTSDAFALLKSSHVPDVQLWLLSRMAGGKFVRKT